MAYVRIECRACFAAAEHLVVPKGATRRMIWAIAYRAARAASKDVVRDVGWYYPGFERDVIAQAVAFIRPSRPGAVPLGTIVLVPAAVGALGDRAKFPYD